MRASFLFSLPTRPACSVSPCRPRRRSEPDELVVVDNASSDDTGRVAGESGARVVRLEERASYSQAMNAGIGACTGDAVALLQADTFVAPDTCARDEPRSRLPAWARWRRASYAPLAPSPTSAPSSSTPPAWSSTAAARTAWWATARPPPSWSEPAEVFGADGAAALYRRETLEDCAIDGEVFDPDLERWASDADVAWRARVLGWICIYEPAALVHHIRTYSPSTRETMSSPRGACSSATAT